MTFRPLMDENDSIVARALPETVTEWIPKTPVNHVPTVRDAVTLTESLGTRSVLGVALAVSAGRPFLPYSDCARGIADPAPPGIPDAPASAAASAAFCTCDLLTDHTP
jgi:hypothetical protein